MATDTLETTDELDVREAMAHLGAFFLKHEKKVGVLEEVLKDLKELRYDITTILNAKSKYEHLNRLAAIELEKAEREARTRLSGVEKGHQTLVDELTKKQIAYENKLAEVEKREAIATERIQTAELKASAYDRKLAELTTVAAPAKAKKA